MARVGALVLVLGVAPIVASACAAVSPPTAASAPPASGAEATAHASASSVPRPTVSPAASCRKLPVLGPLPTLSAEGLPAAVPMPGLATGLPADAPAPLVAACRRLEVQNRAAARTRPRHQGAGMENPDAPPLRRGLCFGNARGAWLIDVGAFRPEGVPGRAAMDAPWSLIFVTPEGKLVSAGGGQSKLTVLPDIWESDVAIVGAADFDGDGVVEALVDSYFQRIFQKDKREDGVSAWRMQGGAIAEMEGRFVVGWRDVDGDGRMDRLVRGPRDDEMHPLVEHGLGGGRFSSDDLVAQASWQRLCPAPPRGPLDTPRAVTCALAWGEDPDEARRRVDEAQLPDRCRSEQHVLVDSQTVKPLLEGACPSDAPAVERAEGGYSRQICP